MNGKIYKITNLINSKVYIGQTTQSIQERWNKHCAKYNDQHFFMPIKQAIFKYGKENFKIEVIESCSLDNLNEREIYWINYFDSYKHGYNCTLGGHGRVNLFSLTEDQELKLCDLYVSDELNIKELSDIFNVDKTTIYNILKRRSIPLKYSRDLSKRISIEEFKDYLNLNPTVKDISKKFNICKCSVYNIINRNNIEYKFPTSVRALTSNVEG